MISGIALRQTSNGWGFVSEAALEKFVWENLKPLFGFKALESQYISNGEICDIVAVDNDGALVILELKNAEDKYLIQQLTRYYSNLIEEKPFSQEIDYSLPIRLISIAPSYHRHNLIDLEYSKLEFELLEFFVGRDETEFSFLLKELDGDTVLKRLLIPFEPIKTPEIEGLKELPDMLKEWLFSCTQEEQEGFLKVRAKILSCHERMKEIIDKKSIKYGSGQTRLCAEIAFQNKSQKPILFLWLPIPSRYAFSSLNDSQKKAVGRLRLWMNGRTISHLGHIPNGFGKMRTQSEWEKIPLKQRPSRMIDNWSSKSHFPGKVEAYCGYQSPVEQADFWDILSTLAIEQWLHKVGG